MATIKVFKKPFPADTKSFTFDVELPLESTPFDVTAGNDDILGDVINVWYVSSKRVQQEKWKFTVAKQDATIEGNNPGQYIGHFFMNKRYFHCWVALSQ